MANMLFETDDRDAAHKELEKVRKEHPAAECREDSNAELPYQVWDGPEEWIPQEPAPEEKPAQKELNVRFTDEELEKIGAAVAKHLKGED